MKEGWLMADDFWGSRVAAADQSTQDAGLCGRGDNAAPVCGPLGPDLAGGKVVSQLRLQDGQWWKRGQHGPLSPGLLVCRCGDLYLYILLYLFICLANQLGVTFPSWRCSFFVPSRKKERKEIRMVLSIFL